MSVVGHVARRGGELGVSLYDLPDRVEEVLLGRHLPARADREHARLRAHRPARTANRHSKQKTYTPFALWIMDSGSSWSLN